MNPLPNRPLLNNSSIPLLPNVPSFDQMSYNGRPRKILPESGNLLNGMSLMSGPSSAPAGANAQTLERSNPLGGSNILQHAQQGSLGQAIPNIGQLQQQMNSVHQQAEPDKEADSEPRSLTAIFRPDDRGEWRERLRQSHEASEQARLLRDTPLANGSAWDRRPGEEGDGKEEEAEVDEDESTEISEGEGGKLWKPKRTLRK